jgi:hypothetical protein
MRLQVRGSPRTARRSTTPANGTGLARHLTAGAVVLVAPAGADDILDPSRRGVVPLTLRTDGAWIWSDASAYYLTEHALAAPAEFLAYVCRTPQAPIDRVTVLRALATLERPGGGREKAERCHGLNTSGAVPVIPGPGWRSADG